VVVDDIELVEGQAGRAVCLQKGGEFAVDQLENV